MNIALIVLIAWVLLCALVVAACVLGGRVDDLTEQTSWEAS